ncbi:MAG TPA: GAF domain-containing protein [Bryobacteraceae bacterium]|nr:GAF domain-containing protein [Bryobacteraceae bacterium]
MPEERAVTVNPVGPIRAGVPSLVLLAEDELSICRHVTAALEGLGQTVLYASDGVEALIISHNCSRKISLLVVDGELAGQVNGLELAEHIVQERPGVTVLMISETEDSARQAAAKGYLSLREPFTAEALVKRLGDALTASALANAAGPEPLPDSAGIDPILDARRQLEQELLERVQHAAQAYHGALDAQAVLEFSQDPGMDGPSAAVANPFPSIPEPSAGFALEHYSRTLKTFSDLIMRGISPSCHELLTSLLGAAVEATGAAKGNIQVVDPAEGVLVLEAQYGFEQPFLDFFQRGSGGTCACVHALKSGQRTIVEDISESPLFRGEPSLPILLNAGVRAVQSTPLFGDAGSVVGVLSTHYPVPTLPTEQDLKRLDEFAAQAAALIVEAHRSVR